MLNESSLISCDVIVCHNLAEVISFSHLLRIHHSINLQSCARSQPMFCVPLLEHLNNNILCAICQALFLIFFCFVVGIIHHVFSLVALVHICIPQTYTPCGRCLWRGFRLTAASCALGYSLATPHLLSLL